MERNENGLTTLFDGRGTPNAGANGGGRAPAREGCQSNTNGYCCEGMTDRTRQLAMVYAPMQCFRMLYNHSEALKRGTLFEELDKPLDEVWR